MNPGAAPGAQAPAASVGIGLRQPHYAAFFEQRPALAFIEVHSENFFADGGAALAVLRQAREHTAVSLHGVGLALGSAAGLDPWHLDRLARLVERIAPVRVSDHACFARSAPVPGAAVSHANDLLPIAFNAASLEVIAGNVERVQERLGRTLLVENLSSYVSFADDTMSEPEFLIQLCRRTGCGLLLDLNNLMVNALNVGDAYPLGACRKFVDSLPRGIVGELHLAGYCEVEGIVIDDHGSRVRPDVWSLYAHTLNHLGPLPTLVEWDTALPPFDVLLGEATRAAEIAALR